MIKEKHIASGIAVCYAVAAILAGIDGDISEVLGWICASAWMTRAGKRGLP